jgi:hypothetical protein
LQKIVAEIEAVDTEHKSLVATGMA